MLNYIIGVIALVVVIFLLIQYLKTKRALHAKNNDIAALLERTETSLNAHKKYISVLSQELRTPLYGIMGLTSA